MVVRREWLDAALRVPERYDDVGISGGKTAEKRQALQARLGLSERPGDRYFFTGGNPGQRVNRAG